MNKSEVSKLTAQILINIGAVNFNTTTPFKLSSGLLSPSYIDCRKIISHPYAFRSVTDMMINTIKRDLSSHFPEYIIGGETAGIPFASVIAAKLDLPLSYVRKKTKDYGKNKLIEGEIFQDKVSILIEDLMTDGKSKIDFVEKIRLNGVQCDDSLVVFKYDLFKDADIELEKNNVKVHFLTNWDAIYNQMIKMGKVDPNILIEIKKFLNDPFTWSNDKKNCG